MKTNLRVALVTGGNRGIGLEVCRQLAQRCYKVLLGTRDRAKGEAAARTISGDVDVIVVDVAEPEAAQQVAAEVKTRHDRLDVLVNNAGVHYDTWQSVETADWKTVREAYEVNVFGAWRMAQAFVPMMRKARWGRIVNVSSEAGSLVSMGTGTPDYSTTKAALNALRTARRHFSSLTSKARSIEFRFTECVRFIGTRSEFGIVRIQAPPDPSEPKPVHTFECETDGWAGLVHCFPMTTFHAESVSC